MRFVCDFRKVNNVTTKDTYLLPNIKDIIEKMSGDVFWTSLDIASAYWLMPLKKEDHDKTTFSIPRGKFHFNVTPFGLCNAGGSYQRMIDFCLAGLPVDRVLAYIDDIVMCTATFDQHVKELERVLSRLKEANIIATD